MIAIILTDNNIILNYHRASSSFSWLFIRKEWNPSSVPAGNRGCRNRPGPWASSPRCRASPGQDWACVPCRPTNRSRRTGDDPCPLRPSKTSCSCATSCGIRPSVGCRNRSPTSSPCASSSRRRCCCCCCCTASCRSDGRCPVSSVCAWPWAVAAAAAAAGCGRNNSTVAAAAVPGRGCWPKRNGACRTFPVWTRRCWNAIGPSNSYPNSSPSRTTYACCGRNRRTAGRGVAAATRTNRVASIRTRSCRFPSPWTTCAGSTTSRTA